MALVLFAFGAILGSIVNWAIYQLCYFQVRAISPLGPRDPAAQPRQPLDYVPIIGWLGIRRDAHLHGSGFWIRPLLIELGLGLFTPWFYYWQIHGGLIQERLPLDAGQGELWYAVHLLLIVLLTAATFIDFDEQTIPDSITIPGTIAALFFAGFFPDFRLPELVKGPSLRHLTFCSPDAMDGVNWVGTWRGLAFGIGVFAVWCLALMPKICTLRFGLVRGFRIMLGSMLRPPRKTKCSIRIANRQTFAVTWWLIGMGIALSIAYFCFWYQGEVAFQSLISSVIGLAFGGGLVWAVRLIAGSALGQEAMGFGDVTLMAMIGAMLGWQASLLVFVFAPFAALIIAAVQFVVAKNRAIAFGPYLAVSAVFLLLNWNRIWNGWAADGIFSLGPLLLAVIAVSLVLLGVMMFGVRLIKGSPEIVDE